MRLIMTTNMCMYVLRRHFCCIRSLGYSITSSFTCFSRYEQTSKPSGEKSRDTSQPLPLLLSTGLKYVIFLANRRIPSPSIPHPCSVQYFTESSHWASTGHRVVFASLIDSTTHRSLGDCMHLAHLEMIGSENERQDGMGMGAFQGLWVHVASFLKSWSWRSA